jgi:hypothetical protein
MKHETLTKVLSADVGQGSTITFDYPAGKTADDMVGGTDHILRCVTKNAIWATSGAFSVAFNDAGVVVTILANSTYQDGETVYLDVHLGQTYDDAAPVTVAAPDAMRLLTPVKISLGAPIASDSDGAVASQACTAAGGLATGINGALASDDVATFDVPRNVVAAWTGTAILTVTGTDAFGNVLVESSGSGTSLTGKKAFKTITGVSTSADITGLTVGNSKVLGLPVFLGDALDVLREFEDEAAPTAGTVVAGITAAATATTGDVRGTYAPNSAPNGSKVFELTALVPDPNYKGRAQYAG